MTKHSGFKKVVRRHAAETGQRYTEALTDLEGLGDRMRHEPAADQLLGHLRARYGIDASSATRLGLHHPYVFRIDRVDGDSWVARAFPPARPRAGAEGDAGILRFLERHAFPAERLAVDDAVSDFGESSVLVTGFVHSKPFGDPTEKLALFADLLGRLHALRLDDSVSRPGGAEAGSDPDREGSPRQDLLAALSFLDSVDTKVAPPDREQFEQLRERVRTADAGEGLPEAMVHGNLLHAPDHALLTDAGVVGSNWRGAGRGPRLSDLAWLLWGTHRNLIAVEAIVDAYRRHIDLTEEELDRLEALMHIRPLYLTSFGYRRNVLAGWNEEGRGAGQADVDARSVRGPTTRVDQAAEFAMSDPDYIEFTATAARAAFRR